MTKPFSNIFISAKPISKKVSKFISYYYFHQTSDENHHEKFTFYPNYKHGLTAYKNSTIILKENASIVRPSTENNIQSLYSINNDQSIKVSIKGPFQKIGIVFNPLGINHFIQQPLQEIFSSKFEFFSYFGQEFEQTLANVFRESITDKKVVLLDDFFEKRYVNFPQLTLKKAVEEIINSNGAISVAQLAENLSFNRRTLLRLFKKHTNMSVEEYRKMVMFRQAFNYYNQHKEETNLTDVALFSMYYDQAHYIKHFKSITKETPGTLLNKISKIGQKDTYWYFES